MGDFRRLRRAEVRILAQKHVTETPGPRGYGKSRVIHVSRNSPQITFHVTRESRLAQGAHLEHMLPRERAVQHLEFEYAEDLVTFPSVTSPVSGQLFVLRPDAKMHRLLRRLAATRASSFDVARGWAGSGLLTWPDADASNARAQCNSTAMRHGLHVAPGQGPRRRCALSPYWIRRCKRHALTLSLIHI